MIRLGIIIFIKLSSLMLDVVTDLYLHLYISSIISIYFHYITLLVHGRVLLRNFLSITYLEYGKLTYLLQETRYSYASKINHLNFFTYTYGFRAITETLSIQSEKVKGEDWSCATRAPAILLFRT